MKSNDTQDMAPVEIHFMNRPEPVKGLVWLEVNQRVVDMMNDGRKFFPLALDNGDVVTVNKAGVDTIRNLATGAGRRS